MSQPRNVSRRTATLWGLAAGLAVVAAGAIVEGPRLLRKRPRGAYSGLVGRLDDPEQAAIVGRAMRASGASARAAADDLAKRLAGRSLPDVLSDDVRNMDGVAEIEGWIVPKTLAQLCLLAAQSF